MTFAIIGHGRSPEGGGYGSKIDACQTVVRMWDWQWQNPLDYGEKYDYGLFVLTPRGLRIFTEHNTGKPSCSWLAYFGKPTAGVLPQPSEVVDTSPWCQIAQQMGGAGLSGRFTLTRGCAAACWAITQAKGKEKQVVLVGFDNVKCGINRPIELSFHPNYWASYNARFEKKIEKAYPIGGAKTMTHDMAVELPLMRMLSEQYGVELVFANDIWQ